MKIQLCW